MIYISLLNNITLLISLTVIHSLLVRKLSERKKWYHALSGLLFGTVAIVGMMNSVELSPGIVFDGRSIILTIAGIFGGPVTAAVAASVSAAYRISMGGAGTIMGVSVIVEAAFFGTILYFLARKRGWARNAPAIYATGVIVHLAMLGFTVLLPGSATSEILSQIFLPVILIYPVATLLVGLLFRSQEAFIRAKIKSEESDRLKTAFLNNLSHEVRTPLNAIVGFSDLITSNKVKEDERKRFGDIISRSSDQLMSLIDDILDMASIEAGEVRVNPSRVNLEQVFSHIAGQFRFKAERNNVVLETDLSEVSDPVIVTDETRLIQVLTNITGNAIKFSPDGRVVLSCAQREADYLFSVSDTGIGIPEDAREFIFERFRQAGPDVSKRFGGTGLGLSIAKSFVELLGGKIWVESEQNEGSVFYFTIPVRPSRKDS